MRLWTYAANSYYKTASYILEEGPWYSFFLEWFIETICEWFPPIPIPFGSKIKIHDSEFNETYTLKEYYGDMSDLFHCFICMKISVWCIGKLRKTIDLETDYEELKKERFNESPELFDEEKHLERGENND